MKIQIFQYNKQAQQKKILNKNKFFKIIINLLNNLCDLNVKKIKQKQAITF